MVPRHPEWEGLALMRGLKHICKVPPSPKVSHRLMQWWKVLKQTVAWTSDMSRKLMIHFGGYIPQTRLRAQWSSKIKQLPRELSCPFLHFQMLKISEADWSSKLASSLREGHPEPISGGINSQSAHLERRLCMLNTGQQPAGLTISCGMFNTCRPAMQRQGTKLHSYRQETK